VFFDAASGYLLGPVWPLPEQAWLWPALDRLPQYAVVTATPSLTPTPYPTRPVPTATSASTPWYTEAGYPAPTMASGAVPDALLETARTMPLVSGSQWRYRTTGVDNGVQWSRNTFTVTIPTAWRWADDAVVADVRLDGAAAVWDSPMGGPRIMLPGTVFGAPYVGLRELRQAAQMPDARAGANPSGSTGPQNAAAQQIFRVPPLPDTRQNYWWWTAPQTVTVAVPAGRFEGCLEHNNIVSAGAVGRHWFCPGVGWVRHALSAGGDWGCFRELTELDSYELPELRAEGG
jgi:hypothetical protein